MDSTKLLINLVLHFHSGHNCYKQYYTGIAVIFYIFLTPYVPLLNQVENFYRVLSRFPTSIGVTSKIIGHIVWHRSLQDKTEGLWVPHGKNSLVNQQE